MVFGKNGRKARSCAAAALLVLTAAGAGDASAQSLARNPLVLQTHMTVAEAATLSEPPDNQYLATAVIQQIAQNPNRVESIVSAAVRAQPASKDFVVRKASAAYPVFADQIAAAAEHPAPPPPPPPPVAAAPQTVAQAPVPARPGARADRYERSGGSWYGNPYLDFGVGLNLVADSSLSDPALGSQDGTLSTSEGFGGTIALGTEINKNFRAEAELGYRTNDLDSIEVGGFGFTSNRSIDGKISVLSAMANGYYDVRWFDSVIPYVGVGAGMANINVDITTNNFDESDLVFAYQLTAGVRYPLQDKSVELRAGYRFFNALSPEFGTTEAEYFAHTLEAGMLVHF